MLFRSADGPERHLIKQGTPTMGGLIMLIAAAITCTIMAPTTPELICGMLAMLATGSLGLLDDIESVAHKRSLGLTPSQKMVGLAVITVVFTLSAVNWVGIDPIVRFPGGFVIDLGVLSWQVPVGSSTWSVPWL